MTDEELKRLTFAVAEALQRQQRMPQSRRPVPNGITFSPETVLKLLNHIAGVDRQFAVVRDELAAALREIERLEALKTDLAESVAEVKYLESQIERKDAEITELSDEVTILQNEKEDRDRISPMG